MKAIPLPNMEAITVARALISNWIARFGVPSRITTDRGKQFECHLFKALSNFLGAEHRPTTSYHPKGNGILERTHRQLKAAITCHDSSNWIDALPLVLLGMRSAFKEDIQATAAELVYGQPLRLPGEFFEERQDILPSEFVADLRQQMQQIVATPTANHSSNKIFIPTNLRTCTHVFVRRDFIKKALQPAYDGPYKVLSRSYNTFVIEKRGKKDTVNISRIKPAFQAEENPEAQTSQPTTITIAKDTATNAAKTSPGANVQRSNIPVRHQVSFAPQTQPLRVNIASQKNTKKRRRV